MIGGGGGVLRRSSAAFLWALPALLAVSSLLFAYRLVLQAAAERAEQVLVSDPQVQSLLRRLSAAAAEPRRRPPLFRLPRAVSPADDDDDGGDDLRRRNGGFNASSPLHNAGMVRVRVRVREDDVPEGGLRLAYLMAVFSAGYAAATAAFLVLYSCAVGVVFLAVAEFLLGRRRRAAARTLYEGSRLGIRRVLGFVFLRWAARDAAAQLLYAAVLSEALSRRAMVKLLVRAKAVPFLQTAAPLTQWAGGDERGMRWFLLAWGLLERAAPPALGFVCWAAAAGGARRRGRAEVLREGLRRAAAMGERGLLLRQAEMLLCWNATRRVLAAAAGPAVAAAAQAVAEVFFLVVWLLCYLDQRAGDARHAFGSRHLEDSIRPFSH
ncbi:uncharacterized protein LOC144710505 [Wolffia australiana]